MKSKPGKPAKARRALTAHSTQLALESRFLFDGAVAATAEQVADDKTLPDNHDADGKIGEHVDIRGDSNLFAFALDAPSDNPNAQGYQHGDSFILDMAGTRGAPTLIIADARADGVRQLLQHPPAETEIRLLHPDKDGYQQIDDILKQRGSTADLHVLTAEIGGKSWLGGSQALQNLTIRESAAVIGWGDHLADNAQITFHGAPLNAGSAWYENIYALTGSAVSWSRDSLLDNQPAGNSEKTPELANHANNLPLNTRLGMHRIPPLNHPQAFRPIPIRRQVIRAGSKCKSRRKPMFCILGCSGTNASRRRHTRHVIFRC